MILSNLYACPFIRFLLLVSAYLVPKTVEVIAQLIWIGISYEKVGGHPPSIYLDAIYHDVVMVFEFLSDIKAACLIR